MADKETTTDAIKKAGSAIKKAGDAVKDDVVDTTKKVGSAIKDYALENPGKLAAAGAMALALKRYSDAQKKKDQQGKSDASDMVDAIGSSYPIQN